MYILGTVTKGDSGLVFQDEIIKLSALSTSASGSQLEQVNQLHVIRPSTFRILRMSWLLQTSHIGRIHHVSNLLGSQIDFHTKPNDLVAKISELE